ncbi:MAG: ribosome-associated translation inhibitor RaiA [Herpetosiphonaceae bacterium]|nr:ribosome-associated translation inhibitor RaiA [Herpetosiphonaceae bacterium]
MEIIIKSRNGKLTEEERNYLEQKLQKLQRYSDGIGLVMVEVSRSQQHNAGTTHITQATLQGEHGVIIRAEQRDKEFGAAVDALHDHLQRQMTRYKERHFRRGQPERGQGSTPAPVVVEATSNVTTVSDERAPRLVKTKQFRYKPMDHDEAIEQMELLDHDFFVFTDAATNQVSVVYRRKDGDYGLIEPGPEAET